MLWPYFTFAAIVAAIVVHFWWRSRLHACTQENSRALANLKNQHEAAVRHGQAQQKAIFDSMVEGLLLLGHDGRIALANAAFLRLFGVSSDIAGKTILEAVRVHQISDLANSLSPERRELSSELRIPGLGEAYFQVNAAAVFDAHAERSGTILVFHELTRVKKLESARQDFVANVSHELRTPLSLINGYVETLLDGAKDNPELVSKFLGIIERNARRLKLLIEDLLTVSELESGRVNLELQPVPLQQLVRKVLNDFRAAAEAKNISLQEDLPSLNIQADHARIEQVLCNLIDNAIKYGRPGGNVVVGARTCDNGQVDTFVQDDGPGIPAESLERVFERFYRVDKGRSRDQGGTGLGLAIVKHIVQSHGGQVWVESRPGAGATFHFKLARGAPERMEEAAGVS